MIQITKRHIGNHLLRINLILQEIGCSGFILQIKIFRDGNNSAA